MTRIGLISDLHGNLPALVAVLADLEQERIEEIVCLGDVAIGPQPVETLEELQALDCRVTMGNWDAWFVQPMPTLDGELGRVLTDLRDWSSAQLDPAQLRYLQTFALSVEIPLDGTGLMLAFHGSPRSYEDAILPSTTDADLEEMFQGHPAPFYAGGHTHFQLFRRLGESIVLNPGSVGLPFRRFETGVMRVAPWAEYAVVSSDAGRLAVDLRRTPYDVDGFVELMLGSGMPHAGWWAELWRD